jgi:hypothetical protein
MIFQKHYNTRGMLLIDILVALSVGTLFVAVLFEASGTAGQLFVWSRERQEFMDIYEAHRDYFDGMFPYEIRRLSVPQDINIVDLIGTAQWFGNDRIETEVTIGNRLTFRNVRSYPFADTSMSAHTPICSVDFGSFDVSGRRRMIFTPITLPGISGEPTDVEVRNHTAYVSVNSSRVSDPDIVTVDISSSTNPRLVSALHTGPGLTSISLVGNKIWTTADSTAAQVHVIAIDDAHVLRLERTYALDRPSTSTPPTVGSVIFVGHTMAFVGTEKWQGSEFVILDITDPALIVSRGALEIGGKVTDIYVRQGIAYVTTATQHQVISIDVRDPDHPSIIETFDPVGWGRQEGKIISYFEDRLEVGRTSGGFDIEMQHELFSWATATSGLRTHVSSRNMVGGVYGIVMDRLYTYIVSRERGKEFSVFRDISQPPLALYPLPVIAQTLTCDNDRLYILDVSSPTLYEVSFI